MVTATPQKLGDKIVFSEIYERKSFRRQKEGSIFSKNCREWQLKKLPEPKEGIVIGYRILRNGFVEYDDETSGFVSENFFPAILVCFSLYRKPVLIQMPK